MTKLNVSFLLKTFSVCLCSLFIICSCSDNKDDDNPDLTRYRLKSISTPDGAGEINLTYNPDNRLQKIYYSVNGQEIQRKDWAWDGNIVTITSETLENGTWVSHTNPKILTYANGKIEKLEDLNDNPTVTIFTWNGDLVSKEIKIIKYGDTVFDTITKDYIYSDDKLTTINYYNHDFLMETTTIEYTNGKPVAIRRNINGSPHGLIELGYTGNNITTVTSYETGSAQSDIECIETRTYDAQNHLSLMTGTCTTSDLQFEYEEGQSDFNDFVLSEGGTWLLAYMFPGAFPSQVFWY